MKALLPKHSGTPFRSSNRKWRQGVQSMSLKINTTVRATTFHNFSGKTLGGGNRENPTEGVEISYSKFKGKVVLINNVATM
jgi:hypothetical protein